MTIDDDDLCCAGAQIFSARAVAHTFAITAPPGSVYVLFKREDGEVVGPIVSREETFARLLHELRPTTVSVVGAPGEDVSALERIVDLAPTQGALH